MEHEVFVPVPVASLRRTLADPAAVARCVPGFQQDADAAAGPLAGRLKVRVGGHTITYRGALTLRPADGGETFSVAGEGVEARGAGSAKLALILSLAPSDGGTTLGFAGTASGDGRILDLEDAAALAAAQRLLDRFVQQLVTESLASRDAEGAAGAAGASGVSGAFGVSGAEPPGDASAVSEPVASESAASEPAASEPAASEPADSAATGEPALGAEPDAELDAESDMASDVDSVFDAPVPPSSLDASPELELGVPDEPPAEAAHARRTMIGRSTEEVDHAPPRGRYAPVPSPESGVAGITLRWIAPAAALAIASAVVVGRALRRRR
ncbi:MULTISPECIES: SRPBCC domain-containing protein [Streptomyces]|uniref:SRPBCC domain-containing protein n=1 Tax=Streptomyces salyersiae TaxID=3075530 RepID=A0ABU2RG17_9ACTN|nr:SRPBCC domain-containing protein [Streptomyces sp. DSM 41770]MDT0427812.1 SRPBCC domain-containing protein [Streptomyces sp. DSM 41770]